MTAAGMSTARIRGFVSIECRARFLLCAWFLPTISGCASSGRNPVETEPRETDAADGGSTENESTDSDEFFSNKGPDYTAVFVEDRLPTFEIHVPDNRWVLLLSVPDAYVEADLTVDNVLYPNVGLRILGSESRTKVSMRIRFDQVDKTQTFHGVKRVNLHAQAGDTSLIREALALSTMREAGIPAPRQSFVWVSTNQGAEGVYTLIEQVDKKFLFDRFGENDGNLYKGERGAGLTYLGDDQNRYPEAVYELKTNEDKNDRSDLVDFIKALNQTDSDNFDVALSAVLDVDGFLRWLAVNTWMVSMDSYAGTVDNYYLYHGKDGRFRFIPWDLNQAFGNYHGASCSGAGALDCTETMGTDEYLTLNPDEPYCGCATGSRPLIERVLAQPSLLARYHEILGELLDGPLALETATARMKSLRDKIEDAAHRDTQKDCYAPPCTNDIYDAAPTQDDPDGDLSNRVPGLIPFIEARDLVLRQALK